MRRALRKTPRDELARRGECHRAARSSSRSLSAGLARDGCKCLRVFNQAPFSCVEKPVDNTPAKGFASGLQPPLTGVLLPQYHMKGGF